MSRQPPVPSEPPPPPPGLSSPPTSSVPPPSEDVPAETYHFPSKVPHQVAAVNQQLESGLYVTKRTAFFLKKICASHEASGKAMLEAVQHERAKTGGWETDRALLHKTAAARCQDLNAEMAKRFKTFATAAVAQVCAPLEAFFYEGEERRKRLEKYERRATGAVIELRSEVAKEREAALKLWEQMVELQPEMDRLEQEKAKDSRQRHMTEEERSKLEKQLVKLDKRLRKTQEKAYRQFAKLEKLRVRALEQLHKYYNEILPDVMRQMQELETERLDMLKARLTRYSELHREMMSPFIMSDVFEQQVLSLSAPVDLRTCVNTIVEAAGPAPEPDELLCGLPCPAMDLRSDSDRWRAVSRDWQEMKSQSVSLRVEPAVAAQAIATGDFEPVRMALQERAERLKGDGVLQMTRTSPSSRPGRQTAINPASPAASALAAPSDDPDFFANAGVMSRGRRGARERMASASIDTSAPEQDNPRWVQAMENFDGSSDSGQLHFFAGDYIEVLSSAPLPAPPSSDPEAMLRVWWMGEVMPESFGGKTMPGVFPRHVVEVVSDPYEIAELNKTAAKRRRRKSVGCAPDSNMTANLYPEGTPLPGLGRVMALDNFDYDDDEDEDEEREGYLSFSQDDVIHVERRDDQDWWYGELDGQHGLFPTRLCRVVFDDEEVPVRSEVHAGGNVLPPTPLNVARSTQHKHRRERSLPYIHLATPSDTSETSRRRRAARRRLKNTHTNASRAHRMSLTITRAGAAGGRGPAGLMSFFSSRGGAGGGGDDEAAPAQAASGEATVGTSLADVIRQKVSKKKRRFQQDGFDLDLTYIHDRLIAMGFPAEGIEGQYRNNMKDVQRFFNERHPHKYKLYNLCSEREYNPAKFEGRVLRWPFDDHNPCEFDRILPFCQEVEDWLDDDPENVAAIHCKAGKGRTGFLISCFLMFSNHAPNAESALQFFALKRTFNEAGVTIPSQRRYVRYFERLLFHPELPIPATQPMHLTTVTFITIPPAVKSESVNVWFTMQNLSRGFEYSSKGKIPPARFHSEDVSDDSPPVVVFKSRTRESIPEIDGDIKVQFYYSSAFRKIKLFQFWLNTRMLSASADEPNRFVVHLHKSQLDKACKDTKHKVTGADFAVDVVFERSM